MTKTEAWCGGYRGFMPFFHCFRRLPEGVLGLFHIFNFFILNYYKHVCLTSQQFSTEYAFQAVHMVLFVGRKCPTIMSPNVPPCPLPHGDACVSGRKGKDCQWLFLLFFPFSLSYKDKIHIGSVLFQSLSFWFRFSSWFLLLRKKDPPSSWKVDYNI